MKPFRKLFLPLFLAALAAPLQAPAATTAPEGFVQVAGARFLDGQGREILLHGMSVINKSKSEGYTPWHTEADFARMREWGMNCIRLGIIWDGIEPEPGVYDEAYLKRLDTRIAWAKANGLYVFLDMHQDLFSVLFSDGAPAWATLTDGKEHLTGAVWSDAYLISPAVQQAFDSFWADRHAPDGIGIQEHYVRMWQMLAKRYAKETAILGYDLMNEPFMGSSANEISAVLLASPFAEKIMARLDGKISSGEELMAMWLTPDGRENIMTLMEDQEIYAAFVDAHTEICGRFEREQLMPMYQRVADAIRTVDTNHILLLETNYHSNMGVYSAIEPLKRPDGTRDPQVAYAPHAYDIVVDTPALSKASFSRLELIFRRHGETAARLNMPLLIGEWGAFGNAGEGVLPGAQFIVSEFERLRAGDIYWEYGPYVAESAYLKVLQRPMPLAVAGKLIQYRFDPQIRILECSWSDDSTASGPTIIYLPDWMSPRDAEITLTPASSPFRLVPVTSGSANLHLEIDALDNGASRTLTVRARP